MSVIHELLPKFYFNAISEAELDLIAPKSEQPVLPLMLDEIISLDKIEPQSDMPMQGGGFQSIVHIEHLVVDKTVVIAAEKPNESHYAEHVKVSLFDEFTKNAKTTFNAFSLFVDGLHHNLIKPHSFITPNDPLSHDSKAKILHPALLKHHYEIASHLLKEGYIDPQGHIKQHSTKLFSMMMADLTDKIADYNKNPQNSLLKKIEHILNVIEVFAEHSEVCSIPDFSQINNSGQTTLCPLSVMLRVYASLAADHQLMSKLKATADFVASIDSSEIAYLNAKHLLHMFPTGKTYELAVGDTKLPFASEGSFGLFTTPFAKMSLEQFVIKLQADAAPSLEIEVFSKLASIFAQATQACENRVLFETAENVATLYHQKNTVLVPTGWEGHFIDVALSKAQALYLHANSGENDSTQNIIGDTFRTLSKPESIDTSFFFDVLTNSQKGFEQTLLQKYGISDPVENIECQAHQFNTCAWDSHRDAIEGLLYIELLNQNIEQGTAKSLAKTYYQQWDNFHGEFVIDNYLKNQPGLPTIALIDMLIESLNEGKAAQSLLLEQALKSPLYADEFSAFIENESTSQDELQNNVHAEISQPTFTCIQSINPLLTVESPQMTHFYPILTPLLPLETSSEPILVC